MAVTRTIGPVTFTLAEDFDFAFLEAYGEPFAVFDRQDSGNLCFGVQGDGGRLFTKLAGAATERANVPPEAAIERMRAACVVYGDLRHPALLGLRAHHAVPGGYVQVFEWFDGVCMGRMYGQQARFDALPVAEKLAMYGVMLDFHVHVAARGYVAVDFYDGCVMYDFDRSITRLCDVEFYHKGPLVNGMGRMWGSGRFMSPEEFTLGAVVDEVTNVFGMGRMAFYLFGRGGEDSPGAWMAAPALHGVAARATQAERDARYQTIAAYRAAWNAALEM